MNEIEKLLMDSLLKVNENQNMSNKAANIIGTILDDNHTWKDSYDEALANTGEEDKEVEMYYRTLINLSKNTPYVESRGDIYLPAGPRYTEFSLTTEGHSYLKNA